MNKIAYLVTFLLISLVTDISGQQFFTKNYNINNGLPDNHITAIFKDSHGYLWLGTKAGLARFDGRTINIFSSLDGLASNSIKSITEDRNGNIWIACYNGGLSKFNGKEFINLMHSDGLINNKLTKIKAINRNNLILIGTEDGLSIYDGNGITSYHISLNNVTERLDVADFLEKDGSVYVLTKNSGLYEFFPKTKILKKVSKNLKINHNSLFAAYVTNTNDTILSLGRLGFLIKNEKSTTIKNIGQVACFAQDNRNNLWIGSNNYGNSATGGIFKLANNKITSFNNKLGIDSKMISSLLFDPDENILWIGTEDNGLYMYAGNMFSYYKADDFNLKSLQIKDIHLDKKNSLWILTSHSLIKKQPDGNFSVTSLKLFTKEFDLFKANELQHKYQYLIDSNGSYEKYQLLIDDKLYNYSNPYSEFRNNKIKILPPGSLFKPNKYDIMLQKSLTKFTGVFSDANNNIWVGTNTGVFKFDHLSHKIKFIDLDDNFFTSYVFTDDNKLIANGWNSTIIYENRDSNLIFNVYPHHLNNSPVNITRTKKQNNKIWFLSTDHFLFLYDNYKFHLFNNPDSLSNQTLNDICFDSYGHIITGGNEGIVYIFEQKNDKLTIKHTLSKLNGLSGNIIKWVNCTPDNTLYIGTNTGINVVNLNDLFSDTKSHIKRIDKSSGFLNYSGFMSELDSSNNLWIAADKELIKIETGNIFENAIKNCKLILKSIEANDEEIELDDTRSCSKPSDEEIILPWYKNSLTFNVDVIKFLDPDNIQFFYTLKNGTKVLSKETSERSIGFQNLNPGFYEFTISTLSEKNSERTNIISIRFLIKNPLYKNVWVILGVSIFLVVTICFFVKWSTRQIKYRERNRLEIAEKIAELELKALRAQMNPHFIFNAINSIQNFMLGNDVDSALTYLSDFAKLIRITLDNVSKKLVTLEEELNYLKYYLSLEEMRFDKKFETIITLPNEFDFNRILIPPMIIQPFIENAIKHGFAYKTGKGLIKIDFQIKTKDSVSDLHCIIEDNGIGRVKSKELNKNITSKQKSRGTKITSERLALLNQNHPRKGYKIVFTDLYNENDEACGTRVDITFPI